MRAEAGHPKPFNLKFIGIGNEDMITDVFEERFTLIYNAVREKHPEITVIGTVGPFYEGTDYEEGWNGHADRGVPMVDEHYYGSRAGLSMFRITTDRYDRNKPKVYLGEYASHVSADTTISKRFDGGFVPYFCGTERGRGIYDFLMPRCWPPGTLHTVESGFDLLQ